jgi:hypothetical protein
MSATWNHKPTDVVSVDETGAGTDYAAVAYCECGWQADHWHHADEHGYREADAYDLAQADAQAHTLAYAA